MHRSIGSWLGAASLLLVSALVWADSPPLAPAPKGFDARREGVERGKVETVEYDSKTVGAKRKMVVYLPPGYSKDTKYPVFYLLHGAGDDETGWQKKGAAPAILDNLYADKKLVPMIVVLANGRAGKDVSPRDSIPKQAPAFAAFERDLLTDLIPFVEKTYPVKADRESRALAGLSMGGGQSLNIGLTHLDAFAWVGGFSSAPNTRRANDLLPDPAAAAKRLKLLWLSCGDRDRLIGISRAFHDALTEKQVPHVWHIHVGGDHNFAVWNADLYHFAPLLFR
jgi:enterochelin esterase-like enzyme